MPIDTSKENKFWFEKKLQVMSKKTILLYMRTCLLVIKMLQKCEYSNLDLGIWYRMSALCFIVKHVSKKKATRKWTSSKYLVPFWSKPQIKMFNRIDLGDYTRNGGNSLHIPHNSSQQLMSYRQLHLATMSRLFRKS